MKSSKYVNWSIKLLSQWAEKIYYVLGTTSDFCRIMCTLMHLYLITINPLPPLVSNLISCHCHCNAKTVLRGNIITLEEESISEWKF